MLPVGYINNSAVRIGIAQREIGSLHEQYRTNGNELKNALYHSAKIVISVWSNARRPKDSTQLSQGVKEELNQVSTPRAFDAIVTPLVMS